MKFLRRSSKKSSSLFSKKKRCLTLNVEEELPSLPLDASLEASNAEATEELAEEPWSDANFDRMAQQWNLTREQQEKMLELEQRLGDVDHWKNDPFEVVRFLKELKWNVKHAEDKFRKMVHWRIENNIDTKVHDYGEPHPLLDYFPSVVLKGVDKEEDPIFLERPGAFDAYYFYREFGAKPMVDYITYRREKDVTRQPDNWQTQYYEPKYGKRVGQFTVIMDVQGLNRNHMRAGLIPLLNVLARITQDNYVGVAKRIIVLRAPAIFKVFWGMVKGFFDPAIRELVTFTTQADYLDVLDLYMDREVLPPQLWEHGEGEFMPGFENVILDGGVMSKTMMANYEGKNKIRSSSSECTEGTDSNTSMLFSDSDDDSVHSQLTQLTEGVKVVSGGLIGGGTFQGQAIYLR